MKYLLLFGAFVSLLTFAQGPADPPKVELKLDSKAGAPGGTIKGKVIITFSPGWHAYQNPPKGEYEIPLKVESATKDLKLKATYPAGKEEEFAGTKTLVYDETVTVPIVLTLPKREGALPFKVDVSYQQCNSQSCLPPGKVTVSDKLTLKKKN